MFSELRFHSGQGQGVQRITTYYKRIKNKEVNINIDLDIVKESSSLALVDAKNGIGTVQASKCMDIAITKAKNEGIGQVIIKNSTHFGSSSVHAVRATKKIVLELRIQMQDPKWPHGDLEVEELEQIHGVFLVLLIEVIL